MKIVLTILLLGSVVSNQLFAQTVEGDWYTPLRNKLLHITISRDSILFRKCSFDSSMSDYGYVDMSYKVEKEVNGNYIVSGSNDTINTFYVFSFKLENGRNHLNLESLNSEFSTLTDAENSMKILTQQPSFVILLNKTSIDKIRRQTDVTTMTSNDFKNFAFKIIELDSIHALYKNQDYKLSNLYIESTVRIIISELGFNTLVKGNVLDPMFEKFKEDPETIEIFNRMTKRGN